MHSGTLRDLFYEADVKVPDDEDISILIGQIDKDKDGQVGVEDYRRLVGQVKQTSRTTSRGASGGASGRLAAALGAASGKDVTKASGKSKFEQRHISTFNSTMKQLDLLQRGNFSALQDGEEFLADMRLLEGTPLLEIIKKEILNAPELTSKVLAQMHIPPASPARRAGSSGKNADGQVKLTLDTGASVVVGEDKKGKTPPGPKDMATPPGSPLREKNPMGVRFDDSPHHKSHPPNAVEKKKPIN